MTVEIDLTVIQKDDKVRVTDLADAGNTLIGRVLNIEHEPGHSALHMIVTHEAENGDVQGMELFTCTHRVKMELIHKSQRNYH